MKILKINIFIVMLLLISSYGYSQCNSFTKKVCMPLLKPYTFNGQLNNALLSEGEVAELQITFYKDQEYRILVMGEDNLRKINFQVLDVDYNILYDNVDEDYSSFWDFMVEDTDDFILRITVPEDENYDSIESGCVSILVGFRAFGSRTVFK